MPFYPSISESSNIQQTVSSKLHALKALGECEVIELGSTDWIAFKAWLQKSRGAHIIDGDEIIFNCMLTIRQATQERLDK